MTTKRRTTIFVNGLDDQITKEILYQTFLPFGEINDVEIPMDPKKPECHRGFGFVDFAEPEDAQAAIDNMHLSELYGRTIKVNLSKSMRYREYMNRAIWNDEEWLREHGGDVAPKEEHKNTNENTNQ